MFLCEISCRGKRSNAFSSLVKIQNVVLDELMEDSQRGVSLAINIKHAELAVKDLIVAVQESNIAVKDNLAEVLTAFVADTRTAARSVQRVSSCVRGLMDR